MVSNSQSTRRSQKLVIRSLMGGKLFSKADLSRLTGLSSPAIGKAANELIASGHIREQAFEGPAAVEAEETGPGRPSRPLGLDHQRLRYVAVQLGVHRTRMAALPLAGLGEKDWPIRFSTPRTPHDWVEALREAARRLPVFRPELVIASTPGVVDEARGCVLYSPNLHWTEGDDLAQAMRRLWDAPVRLVQEIRALALGHRESEAGDRDFLLVDFGAGVGAAMIREGELYQGPVALSGELGHTPVHGNDRPCGCGATGCIETLVSRQGILASFREAGASKATWPALRNTLDRKGIPRWFDRTLQATAHVIAGALNMTGQTRVVVTGSLTELPAGVLERLGRLIVQGAMWGRFGCVTVKAAPRRRAAGLVIAAIEHSLLSEGLDR